MTGLPKGTWILAALMGMVAQFGLLVLDWNMPFKFRQQSWSGIVTAWLIAASLSALSIPWLVGSPWRKNAWLWIGIGSLTALGATNLLTFGEYEQGVYWLLFALALLALVAVGLGVAWASCEWAARILRLAKGERG